MVIQSVKQKDPVFFPPVHNSYDIQQHFFGAVSCTTPQGSRGSLFPDVSHRAQTFLLNRFFFFGVQAREIPH